MSVLLVLVLGARAAHADDFTIEGSTAKGRITIESQEAAKKLLGVTRVVGSLTIQNYDGADLSVLRKLLVVDGDFVIFSNAKLTKVDLPDLERVYGIFWISSNPKLTDLSTLTKLRAAMKALTITDNPSLTKLPPNGLTIGEPIKKIKGSLTIRGNTSLPAADAEDYRKRCTVGGLVEVTKNGP
jgi:hypothetical protein